MTFQQKFAVQQSVGHDVFKAIIGKNLQPRILYPARVRRLKGERKNFIDKQELKECSTTKSALQEMLKGLLETEKKRPQLEGLPW